MIAHTVELLGGGVPSGHPSCPGAVFRLQPDYNLGAPDPQADVVAKLLQGGSRPTGRWADNRTVTLPVVILGPDRATIVAGRELLAMICDQQRYEVVWERAGSRGPMILDAYRASQPVPAYSVIEERQDFCRVQITFAAAPYGRSEFREELWFPSPAAGGPPPPIYQPWEAIDDYTVVHSRDQDDAWDRAEVPGYANGNVWPYSAHWSPARGRETPVYHRVLTHGITAAVATASAPDPDVGVTRAGGLFRLIEAASPPPPRPRPAGPPATPRADAAPYDTTVYPAAGAVDLAGRQHLNLWVGLGNNLGQWRSGNLTFSFVLYDENRNTMRFGGTFYLWASDNPGNPNFTRISVPMPLGGTFGLLTEYRIECPTFVRAARMGDFYLHLLGVAPAAEEWHSPTSRGTVYVLRSRGTARTPMSVKLQSPPGDPNDPTSGGYAVTEVLVTPGRYHFTAPAAQFWAPDGTENAMQVRVHAGGGAGGSRTTAGVAGGGAGGGVAGDDRYQMTLGEVIEPVTVGLGGYSDPYQLGQLPPGQDSQFGYLRATGGSTARTNDYLNVPPGQGLAPAPIRYTGGWSGYGVSAGQDGQGGGGGGGGGGSAGDGGWGGVNGSGRGQPGGRGGPGGGGYGGGGQSPYVPGGGVQGGLPGGGGGGAANLPNYSPAWGAYGSGGVITATYIRSLARLRSVLVHMPNPDSDATFVPVISVQGGDRPGGTPTFPDNPTSLSRTYYYPVSPHLGMPVKYNGTYLVMLAVYSFANDASSHTITAEIRLNGPSGPVEVVTASTTLIPTFNDAAMAGMLTLGTVTLPPRWMPPDNQQMTYDFAMTSNHQGDVYLDLILLDVTGSTVCCMAPASTPAEYESSGYSNWFIDEPESGQSMGGILGSNFGRTAAAAATNAITGGGFVSGGPFMLEPGVENLFLAYSFDRLVRSQPSQGYVGTPSLAAGYYPRWWFDRADDHYDPPAAGGETTVPGRPYQRPATPPSARALPPGA